ncbi:bifunctional 3-(3-hydroxy-phenyl)propionate/3-hydroxycinnamic acid hydroxylase [Flexithrix dorotheae]|uniref:bifunctional 3-(3-hydroxy-phenyl)propionate/3-hydroxycinnamic acid hydroxylase n=1 Tax=Flexithrix dorotheae TaxID=70993 RepID=UPI00036D5D5C|nr:bifunctional 3-(3-hydroxy-phenyl)propionate/3-hydroxycinnamic acid hydroxylase [Flexithrix dorotheae]
MTLNYDVIIVGYGPVGMVAANIFGMYGLKTLVIEKNTTLYNIPRAIHFDDEIMRIFQYIDLEKEILEISKPVPGLQLIDKNQKVLFQITKGVSSGWESSYLFYQPELESCLHQGVQRFENVDVKMGVKFTTLSQSTNEISLSLVDNGNPLSVKGKYLIGCDGANSTVRKFLKLPLRNLGFTSANLKIDLTTKTGNYPQFSSWIQKLCEPKLGSFVFLNGRANHLRWEFSLHKKIPKSLAESPEFVEKNLSKVIDPKEIEIRHIAFYQFRSVIAKKWRVNKVFLTGDAAHQMPPYIGQGMAAGIRDVSNLSWKLFLKIQENAGDKLLESYQKERFSHVFKVIILTILVGKLFISKLSSLLKAAAWVLPNHLRKIKISEIPLSNGYFGRNKKTKGKLFIQPEVHIKGEATSIKLDKVLGKGFVILSLYQSPIPVLSQQNQDFLKRINFKVLMIKNTSDELKMDEEVCDSDNELKKWFSRHRVEVVVLRPDRYIFDTSHIHNLNKTIDYMREKLSL